MSRAAPASDAAIASAGKWLSGYIAQSELPLHGLIFLLPAMVLFEVGQSFHPSDPIAFRLLQIFFHQTLTTGRFVPALSIVAILLTWHIVRKDPWQIRMETLWGMLIESILLAVPLLALGISVARWHIHIPLWGRSEIWENNAILSLGAGIYEEFVFRLALMTLLYIIAADVFKLHKGLSNLLMVLFSAILFSLYHYLGAERFQLQSFVFRTVAGVYFGILFLTRGFGITAGCHIFYDITVVTLQAIALH
jgi:membrane protease YdiL (CAAX protease family)